MKTWSNNYYLLLVMMIIMIFFPIKAYRLCNDNDRAVNVLVFANKIDAANFLNDYDYSQEESGPLIPVPVNATQLPVGKTDLPTTGWIRMNYSSKGSDLYFYDNNAIKRYDELKSISCLIEEPSAINKLYGTRIKDGMLYFLVFDHLAVIKKLRNGSTQYYIHLIDLLISSASEEISTGGYY